MLEEALDGVTGVPGGGCCLRFALLNVVSMYVGLMIIADPDASAYGTSASSAQHAAAVFVCLFLLALLKYFSPAWAFSFGPGFVVAGFVGPFTSCPGPGIPSDWVCPDRPILSIQVILALGLLSVFILAKGPVRSGAQQSSQDVGRRH